MLNDLILLQAAISLRPGPVPTEPSRLSFQPLAPWMIDELRRRSERNRRNDAPQVELPLEQPAQWPIPIKDWQD
ncbi:MAG: hypothetical protein KIT43_04090 [Bauldia sp.]|nr:hypothetical protein [Bauldia sp.]MCW5717860.1 hypothetical protein [Bauldia sp.]